MSYFCAVFQIYSFIADGIKIQHKLELPIIAKPGNLNLLQIYHTIIRQTIPNYNFSQICKLILVNILITQTFLEFYKCDIKTVNKEFLA